MLESTRARLSVFSDPRWIRTRYLAALTHAMDRYLRSPLFLAWVRYGVTVAIEAQVSRRGLAAQPSGNALVRCPLPDVSKASAMTKEN
jgi:hypothetical protein